MDMDTKEILEDFLIEAFELVEQIDQDLVELESNPEDLELLNRIFRVAHTVKGSGSFLNFDVLTKLTHHMEDVLNKARHNELKITPEIMDVILESVDMMKGLLEAIKQTGTDQNSGIEIEDICNRFDAISQGRSLAEITQPKEEQPQETKEEEEEEEPDYSNMSPEEIEAEIERLLQEKQKEKEAKKAKKRLKKRQKKYRMRPQQNKKQRSRHNSLKLLLRANHRLHQNRQFASKSKDLII